MKKLKKSDKPKKIQLYVQKKTAHPEAIPLRKKFQLWVKTALQAASFDTIRPAIEITIRLVDESESAQLNQQYRHKSGPTNILSFCAENTLEIETYYLGDLLICVPLVLQEAAVQNKPLDMHWAHLTIHGILHLLGYDHEKKTDAVVMEKLEILILKQLGYGNPYE